MRNEWAWGLQNPKRISETHFYFFTQYGNPLAVKTFNLHLQLHCHSIYHIQLIKKNTCLQQVSDFRFLQIDIHTKQKNPFKHFNPTAWIWKTAGSKWIAGKKIKPCKCADLSFRPLFYPLLGIHTFIFSCWTTNYCRPCALATAPPHSLTLLHEWGEKSEVRW